MKFLSQRNNGVAVSFESPESLDEVRLFEKWTYEYERVTHIIFIVFDIVALWSYRVPIFACSCALRFRVVFFKKKYEFFTHRMGYNIHNYNQDSFDIHNMTLTKLWIILQYKYKSMKIIIWLHINERCIFYTIILSWLNLFVNFVKWEIPMLLSLHLTKNILYSFTRKYIWLIRQRGFFSNASGVLFVWSRSAKPTFSSWRIRTKDSERDNLRDTKNELVTSVS